MPAKPDPEAHGASRHPAPEQQHGEGELLKREVEKGAGQVVLYRSGGTDRELVTRNVREDGRADLADPKGESDELGPVILVSACPEAKDGEPLEGHYLRTGPDPYGKVKAAKEEEKEAAKEAKEQERDRR